jgi:5'-methylthioadenosine phosphorylase
VCKVLGIIGGSGLYDVPGLEKEESLEISTPFGPPSDSYRKGRLSGKEVIFLPRHGSGHHIQPHRINYRANIAGFRQLGVEKIISIGAAGAINHEMKPGSIVVPDQIIDMTSGRSSTFFDGDEVVHVDFTEPFCPDLRNHIFKAAARRTEVVMLKSGVYICVNGPRLETAAEIRTFSLWGADIVGMTLMPEAVLAREAGICFAGMSVVANYAAGIVAGKLTATEVVKTMQTSAGQLRSLLESVLASDFRSPSCSCKEGLEGSRI